MCIQIITLNSDSKLEETKNNKNVEVWNIYHPVGFVSLSFFLMGNT